VNLVWAWQYLATAERVLKWKAEKVLIQGETHIVFRLNSLVLVSQSSIPSNWGFEMLEVAPFYRKRSSAKADVGQYVCEILPTSKQIQHSSCPESGLHLCFPSSLLSRQTLQTSQWKDLSLYILKRKRKHVNTFSQGTEIPISDMYSSVKLTRLSKDLFSCDYTMPSKRT